MGNLPCQQQIKFEMYKAKHAPSHSPHAKIPNATNQKNSACTLCQKLGKSPGIFNHSLPRCPVLAKYKALIQCSKEDRLVIIKDAMGRIQEASGKKEEKELQGSDTPSSSPTISSAVCLGGFKPSQGVPKDDDYPQFHLRTLKPVPSMALKVKAFGVLFTITLDSGATVSFMSRRLCELMGVQIRPNGQLATLADPRYQVRSAGEVDFIVTETTTGKALLRVRALVMEKLAVDCYGGTTFHLDNHLVPDITSSLITAHGGLFVFNVPPHGQHPSPPPSPSAASDPFILSTLVPTESTPPTPNSCTGCTAWQTFTTHFQKEGEVGMVGNGEKGMMEQSASPPTSQATRSGEPILMKAAKSVLPDGTYSIPLKGTASASAVLILPPTPHIDSRQPAWEPQVCEVVSGSAVYVNHTDSPLYHPKNTHFRALPMAAAETMGPSLPIKPKQALLLPPASPESILSQLKINNSLLTSAQQASLKKIHLENLSAFNEDMSQGFMDTANPYRATFTFRKENRPPPFKIWVPNYNRKCQDLLQAKCDQLEQQTVMVDPQQHNIPIRTVSPCFITQKARAKHKRLEDCSLDEVRLITCFNVLNDSIHPIPGRSNSYNDILKFFSRHRYLVCADLTNSYFQIKVDKKHWKYLGVMTPHRGIRVMSRLGQGLLNSDVDLDQVLGRVLGDEQTAGFCLAARDDVFVGGDTVDECIANWNTVLTKLNQHNLKVNPRKVRVMLGDVEVFGHRVMDGTVRPSDHIITTLAATTTSDLVTIKQVNSWKGLYKTLIRHLPHLASVMTPFDQACASKISSSKFDWSRPGILAAFNTATSHLKEIQTTYLPRPEEQLVLEPDTSSSEHCTGWALYTLRKTDQGIQKLPVQYASAKLAKYMAGWCPCEKEGVGAVVAIDQVRHWVNESHLPTIVLPDNKPVVDAAALMKLGRHSTNARLQQLLACVNKSNVIFRHNSAKAGLHMVADALSRLPRTSCGCKDCQVERFLDEIPEKVAFMPITLATIALSSIDPATLATLDLTQIMGPGMGPIPLGSRQTWINLQADCPDCVRFLTCKKEGQIVGNKDKDKTVLNKLFKSCEVDKGLIVSKNFDHITMREISRVYVPAMVLEAILTIMHVRLRHPLPTQLQRTFERYFIAFRVKGTCDMIAADCSLCTALKRFPRELDTFSPSPGPLHPGSHMNADVMRRASQLILVNCDRFSNFVTACITPSEKREDMVQSLLSVITPVRHSSSVQVRTDRAKALSSLADRPDPQLAENGIHLDLGDHGNKNSNAAVDKMIQELEAELRRLSPEGQKITTGILSQAVTSLNSRIRSHGYTASQVHFSRDANTGTNLAIKDKKLWESREKRKAKAEPPTPPSKQLKPGRTVYLKADGTKHTARDPFIVTNIGNKVTVQKMLHTDPSSAAPPRITHQKLQIDPRFIYIPPHRRTTKSYWQETEQSSAWEEEPRQEPRQQPPPTSTPPWMPTRPAAQWEEEEEYDVIYQAEKEDEGDGQLRLRPLHQLLAGGDINPGEGGMEGGEPVDREEGNANEPGEGGEQEADEVAGPVVHERLPKITQGPRQRRRPPREQWVLAQTPQPQQPAVAQDPQPQQQVAPQVDQREEEEDQRHLTGSGRLTRPPDFYGLEKGRNSITVMEAPQLDISSLSADRECSPISPTPTASCSPTPPGSIEITPIPTPETSPDSSAVEPPRDLSWWLDPMPCSQGRTEAERTNNVLERHRHWSFQGPGIAPDHPRFSRWHGEWRGRPPRRRSSTEH